MSKNSSCSEYFIKHILSPEWIAAKYISDDENNIELLLEDINSISFEKDDKVIFYIKSKNKNCTYNTVVTDIDFPTYDKIAINIKKPFERRCHSRYNVQLPSSFIKEDLSVNCSVIDVSSNGFKLLTDSDLTVKDYISLNVYINDNNYIEARCKVIYKAFNNSYNNNIKYIYGLKITKISEINKSLLLEFVSSLK